MHGPINLRFTCLPAKQKRITWVLSTGWCLENKKLKKKNLKKTRFSGSVDRSGPLTRSFILSFLLQHQFMTLLILHSKGVFITVRFSTEWWQAETKYSTLECIHSEFYLQVFHSNILHVLNMLIRFNVAFSIKNMTLLEQACSSATTVTVAVHTLSTWWNLV